GGISQGGAGMRHVSVLIYSLERSSSAEHGDRRQCEPVSPIGDCTAVLHQDDEQEPSMNHVYRSCLLPLALLLLAACALGPRPVHQSVTPTIGPVQQRSGGAGTPDIELIANTNCAEVGEIVTFTIRMMNRMSLLITFTGTPLVDIVLKPSGESVPLLRWSTTSQYPKDINPVFAPGEIRTYQWQWVADAAYVQPQQTTDNGVIAQLTFGDVIAEGYSPLPGGSIEVYVGVGTHILPMPGTNVRCADMRR
ncbi:MAG: hypothetical protein ABI901_03135, partial [Roseiflexaceae bacterium]